VELPIDECDRLASDGSDPERVTAPSETIPIGAIAACEIAVRANPESRRFAFQLGVALATHNRLRDAMPWYRKAAAAGHAEAMHKLGHALMNGKNGVAINLAEAAEWFRKSAELGQGAPARDYALMLQAGTGVAKDTVGAVKWLRRGAELGDAASMTLYAGELDEGRTVAKNPVEAMQWYRRAIDNGDTDAFWPLAVILEEGRGTRRDFVEAAFLIYRALQKGDAHSFEQMTTNATNWDVEFRRELQKLLKRDGHYSGPLDGSFGGSTQAALKKVFKADP
jgi:TPR repeat protein